MIKVEKVDNSVYPNIRISDGIKSFVIARNNFPDPCWYPEINFITNNDDITFTIREEDGDIYILFNKLYQDIIDANVFPLTDRNFKCKTHQEIEKLKQEKQEENEEYKEVARRSGLVNNGVICLHSDDYDEYEYASTLTIKKVDNNIEITFSKNKINHNENFSETPPTYLVRITESGGRYWPFHMVFVKLHRNLQALKESSFNEESISKEKYKVI